MAVDPTDPETFADEDTEQDEEFDVEAPAADAAEQQADVRPDRDDRPSGANQDRANEADLIEQARVVSIDEDDYR
ncbi:hypothetical protein [Streptomyces sp. AC550_RSS872]|uniref:hypothetical protein n=1 Tax=Streptomyces sp. AC550_RSS872 TaxID=2823689 RepID=UPI001C27285B|nr:hypothetical protein [Streptomyces sp. AC550_RSS872]